jgi:hypothetical protein
MELNTLVRHRKGKFEGIGCVSKVNAKTVKVNVGTRDVTNYKKEDLELVDTSHCKTIEFSDLRRMILTNSDDIPSYVIIGNELKHYVGITWVTHGVVTDEDLKKYPRVVM